MARTQAEWPHAFCKLDTSIERFIEKFPATTSMEYMVIMLKSSKWFVSFLVFNGKSFSSNLYF